MSDHLAASLAEAAALVRDKRASATELVRACLDAIGRDGADLNAFIRIDADGALAGAAAADAAVARGEALGPLHGVPLAHKDMFYRPGVPVTCGSKIRRAFHPEITATVLQRLDDAGAVSLGALNMSEFAMGPSGHNAHFGRAHNPWQPEHVTGGSSSGSGAAVGGRLAFGALGSDTGGSIRLPAACCGVVGLKPTQGRVSRHGAMGLSFSLDCIGPLARTSRDAWLMFSVIAGHDPHDATSSTQPVAAPEFDRGDLKGLRVGVSRGFDGDALHPEVAAALDRSRKVLASLGAELVEVEVPNLGKLSDLGGLLSGSESATLHWDWVRSRPQDYGEQVFRRLQPGFAIPSVLYLRALQWRGELLAEMLASTFTACDVLHAPVIREPVPRAADYERDVAADLFGTITRFTACTRPINYLGLPALSVPTGFDSAGLPTAMQLVGRPFDEATLLTMGHLYEHAAGLPAAPMPDLAGRDADA